MEPSPVDRYLTRIVLLLVACLLGVLCVILGRVAVSIDRVAGDIEKVTATAARVADDVNRVVDRVEQIEQKMNETLKVEEVRGLLAEIEQVGPDVVRGDGPSDANTEAEIKYLLKALRDAEVEYIFDDESQSPRRFVMKLKTKYRIYRKAVATAEDFIEKIAAKTVTGKPYTVKHEDGSQSTVSEWLHERLNQHRAAAEK